jgi:DNA-binding Lrp family transcriptional regulator
MPKAKAIDELDAKILASLLSDARKNFASIAKELSVSRNTVWNHFRNMEKAGIITGATLQVNYKKLGYDCLASLLLSVEPSLEDRVCKYLAGVPETFGPFKSTSKFNLGFVKPLKSIVELEALKEALRWKADVLQMESNIWNGVWLKPENLSLIHAKPPAGLDVDLEKDAEPFTPDEIDMQIIGKLTKDSRKSFRIIAKELGISNDTVARRYEQLIVHRCVTARIQIAPEKIGYQAIALFYVGLTPERNSVKIVDDVCKIPDVFYIMKNFGDSYLGVMLMVKTIQDILATGELISKIAGAKKTETILQALTDKWPLPRTYTSTI